MPDRKFMFAVKNGSLTASPSLAQGLPFWRYFPWFCLFFWPPSANLHNKGSVGTEGATRERESSNQSREQKHTDLAPTTTISGSSNTKQTFHAPGTPGGVLMNLPLKCWIMASHFSVDSILKWRQTWVLIHTSQSQMYHYLLPRSVKVYKIRILGPHLAKPTPRLVPLASRRMRVEMTWPKGLSMLSSSCSSIDTGRLEM